MYSCESCKARPFLYQMLGHDGPPEGLWDNNLITDAPLRRCPIRDLLEAPRELRAEADRLKGTYFPLYKKGHLLVAGGIADQPARWLDAMTFLENLEQQQQAKYTQIKQPTGAS